MRVRSWGAGPPSRPVGRQRPRRLAGPPPRTISDGGPLLGPQAVCRAANSATQRAKAGIRARTRASRHQSGPSASVAGRGRVVDLPPGHSCNRFCSSPASRAARCMLNARGLGARSWCWPTGVQRREQKMVRAYGFQRSPPPADFLCPSRARALGLSRWAGRKGQVPVVGGGTPKKGGKKCKDALTTEQLPDTCG